MDQRNECNNKYVHLWNSQNKKKTAFCVFFNSVITSTVHSPFKPPRSLFKCNPPRPQAHPRDVFFASRCVSGYLVIGSRDRRRARFAGFLRVARYGLARSTTIPDLWIAFRSRSLTLTFLLLSRSCFNILSVLPAEKYHALDLFGVLISSSL